VTGVSRTRIALVVLFFASFMVAPTPAQAASTVLCTGYTSCADQGYPHAGYASAKSTSYWNMYTGTNCTNYAAYRLITTNGLPNKRPAAGVGNARDWGTAMASVTNSTPAVGAIAWWGKTGNHVAYIERVVSSSEIWVSESNWSGAFDWRKITKSGGGWPDGIIHFADTAGVPAAPKTLVSSSLPTITGTVRYGGTLTASGGAWSPAPSTLGYQWAVGGVDVAGATTTTFKPRPQDIGKPVTVRVRAAKSGYTATFATSSPTGAVAPAPMSASVRPAVIGTPKVGKRLTASTGTWSRTGLSFSYQWLSDGVAVAGATASVYPVRSLDANRVVTVQVTAQRAGYVTTTVSSAPTARVTPGTITSASRPTVSGNARVGSRLTASPGTFSPSADVSYQWYAEGKAIAGATERTLIPSYRQRDGRIKVKVTARKTGFSSLSATSAYTAPVRTGQIRSIGQPTIDGAAVVGTTLSVVPGTTTPAKVSARYQWLRDGKAISGGTGRTHRVSANDLGRRLSVRVTLKATGYAPRVVTTAPTRGVRSAARITATIARSAAGSLTVSVRVKASGIPAPRGTVTVRPATGPARAATIGNGRATITLTGLAPGAQVVRITFGGTSSIGPVTIQRTVTVT
jgi:surface antigen